MIVCKYFLLLETFRNFFYEFNLLDSLFVFSKLLFLFLVVFLTIILNGFQQHNKVTWTNYAWFSLLFIFTFILHIPVFSIPHIHIDESQHIAEGITLAKNPVFWKSVDGTTVGPIAIYLVAGIKWLGIPVYFHTIRILNLLLWFIVTIFIYRIFHLKFNANKSRIYTLPIFIIYPFFFHRNYIAYNGEISAILLLTIVSFLIISFFKTSNRSFLLWTGGLLVLIPFAKLQAGLAAFLIGFYLLIKLRKNFSSIKALISGVLIPVVLIAAYLILSGTLNDFWQAYIINNAFYAVSGEGIETNRSFISNIFRYLLTTFDNLETRIIFLYAHTFFLVSIISFFYRSFRSKINDTFIYLLILFFLMFLVITVPGNRFQHYAILLIPAAILLIGFFYELYLKKIIIRFRNEFFILLFVLIPALSDVDFYNLYFFDDEKKEEYMQIKEISNVLCSLKEPNDRLAVWGWPTYLYPDTGLLMGTREAHTQRQILSDSQQDYYIERYLHDLKKNQPALFIDSTERDYWIFDYEQHNYKNFPRINDYISRHYEYVIEIYGTEIYKRK